MKFISGHQNIEIRNIISSSMNIDSVNDYYCGAIVISGIDCFVKASLVNGQLIAQVSNCRDGKKYQTDIRRGKYKNREAFISEEVQRLYFIGEVDDNKKVNYHLKVHNDYDDIPHYTIKLQGLLGYKGYKSCNLFITKSEYEYECLI